MGIPRVKAKKTKIIKKHENHLKIFIQTFKSFLVDNKLCWKGLE